MEAKDFIFPFFWQHGESEEKLREYMKVIQDSNLNAVCVESRPHPDFCGTKWWSDMDIILDEARKRSMRVWILDDSHFPTGFANGAVENAPDHLRRQSIYTYSVPVKNKSQITVDLSKAGKSFKMPVLSKMMNRAGNKGIQFDDDRLLGAAVTDASGRLISAKAVKKRGKVTVRIPKGAKKVHITYLSRNFGIHRKYINMLDQESCRILIDAVYEPHFKHYKEDFGKTISGFFSDEPEIGNGYYFSNQIRLGKNVDQPWSRELETKIAEKLGEDWTTKLVLLWDNEAKSDERVRVRYVYMDLVTRLVEKNFSKQIGDWCTEHGVEYIGHMIEDNNQHSRTGASLGHYFRGLAGQHMAGIDDIGGQVIPQKEDAPAEGLAKLAGRDGEFYHYMLGRMGASLAAIDPVKQGRCMCEIFGNYGWGEGPRLEKQLADHFMVRGINRFVPHAFSPKEYPDKDCPPHFYANGHNPQYRAFGCVMNYMNRICALISDGKPVIDTAILYPGDMEWMGEAMLGQKPARVLEEHQVPFHFLPCDVFEEKERYGTVYSEKGLIVNENTYTTLLVPDCEYIPKIFADAVEGIQNTGCRVIFIDSLPKGIVNHTQVCPVSEAVRKCKVIKRKDCYKCVHREMVLSPANPRVHVYHYKGTKELYYLVNEDAAKFQGKFSVPYMESCVGYDAWDDRKFRLNVSGDQAEGRTDAAICLEGGESLILFPGGDDAVKSENDTVKREGNTEKGEDGHAQDEDIDVFAEYQNMKKRPVRKNWRMGRCKSVEYPDFKEWTGISEFTDIGKKYRKFSGYLAYETSLAISKKGKALLEITDAGEDVEVFVNGISAGIKVMPPFRFDISELLKEGKNKLRVEVATTLERERGGRNCRPIGILGEVNLYQTGE